MLGLFEGSLDIQLEKNTFSPGETIRGKVTVKLSQPKKARALRIAFYGEIKKRTYSSKGSSTQTERVYEVTQQLSGEKTYGPGEQFDFSIVVPQISAPPQPQGVLGMVTGFLTSAFIPYAYFVHATLDVPMEVDQNKRVQVNITPPSTTQNAASPSGGIA